MPDAGIEADVVPSALPHVLGVVEEILRGEQIGVFAGVDVAVLHVVRIEVDDGQNRVVAVRRLFAVGNDFRIVGSVELQRRIELQRAMRVGDTAARMGGDEFTVVLGEVADEAQAQQIAERLRRAVQQPVELGGTLMMPRASVGVACDATGDIGAEELLRRADQAMYRAKTLAKAFPTEPAA